MEWIVLTVLIICLLYILAPVGTKQTATVLANNTADPSSQYQPSPLTLQFYQPQEPFYSPGRNYIWDPYNRRWIRNHSGEGWGGFILGIIVMLVLLWVGGMLG